MGFRISGVPAAQFADLFCLSDEALATRGAVRQIAGDGTPCRISLTDAELGEEVILVHYEHHPVATPYRSGFAIFVREGEQRYDKVDQVPLQLRSRMLSVRAYDDAGMLVDAELVDGTELEAAIQRLFADRQVGYLHVHFATFGCYAARVERAG